MESTMRLRLESNLSSPSPFSLDQHESYTLSKSSLRSSSTRRLSSTQDTQSSIIAHARNSSQLSDSSISSYSTLANGLVMPHESDSFHPIHTPLLNDIDESQHQQLLSDVSPGIYTVMELDLDMENSSMFAKDSINESFSGRRNTIQSDYASRTHHLSGSILSSELVNSYHDLPARAQTCSPSHSTSIKSSRKSSIEQAFPYSQQQGESRFTRTGDLELDEVEHSFSSGTEVVFWTVESDLYPTSTRRESGSANHQKSESEGGASTAFTRRRKGVVQKVEKNSCWIATYFEDDCRKPTSYIGTRANLSSAILGRPLQESEGLGFNSFPNRRDRSFSDLGFDSRRRFKTSVPYGWTSIKIDPSNIMQLSMAEALNL